MKTVIRPLEKADAAFLAELDRETFSLPWSVTEFEKLATREYCTYFVAEADGKIVGCAGYVLLCGEADIDKVVVEESFRGQGIASDLLRTLLEFGERHGAEAFTLEVRVSNEPAIRLYEKYGFVTEGIRPGYYEKPTEDARIMWRR